MFAVIIISLFFTFLIMCGVTWAICFICGLIGFTINFSLPLVFAVWFICVLLKLFFGEGK